MEPFSVFKNTKHVSDLALRFDCHTKELIFNKSKCMDIECK